MADIIKAAKQALTKPPDFGYWGGFPLWENWGICGPHTNRDSNLLAISNYFSIKKAIEEEFGQDVFDEGNFGEFGYKHFAYGYGDSIVCKVLTDSCWNRISDSPVPQRYEEYPPEIRPYWKHVELFEDDFTPEFLFIFDIASNMEAVFDESDYSDREYAAAIENLQRSYDVYDWVEVTEEKAGDMFSLLFDAGIQHNEGYFSMEDHAWAALMCGAVAEDMQLEACEWWEENEDLVGASTVSVRTAINLINMGQLPISAEN